ncbi:receptor-like protein EIX1 [Carya illinoinensis]|uniref:receptor-like protein EIX1 n=1 Tax=Carya illinoinensis TaxID=32201 RepID=UPI001C7273EA|nr:receptor-like protein EIX1 [Carya illinoinensis]
MTSQLLSINASFSSQLLFLDLSENSFTCSTFHWLFNSTTSLVDLHLTYINGLHECSIPDAFGGLNSLRTLDLAGNMLVGGIPRSFWNLCSLDSLYLSSNDLSGNLYEFISNALDWDQLSQIKWLQSQKNYTVLDISDAGISDIIPAWFWDFPLRLNYLAMYNNQLHGNLPDLSSSRLDEFAKIDLSANLFDGSIPHFPSNVSSLDLSNNRFSGSLSFLCELNTPTLLESLNISNNTPSGELLDCWTYIRDLVVLNLANNNFYGKIPDSMGSLVSVQLLHLSNNGLVGKIPASLKKCSKLITIDLRANNLSGTIPPWIGDSLPKLVILNLRSNQLYGSFPLSLCHLSYIQILDISSNKIKGTIPECISNLTAMSRTMDTISSAIYASNRRYSYIDHTSLVWKGREFEFKHSLGLVKVIDLSNNKLHGEIPEGITNLTELIALNLSRNNLSGLITPKIGKIPTGTQIQSFDAFAFLENPKLCGSPLPNKCLDDLHPSYINTHGDKNQNVQENDDDRFITKGFYVAATLGFIGGFWGAGGSYGDVPLGHRDGTTASESEANKFPGPFELIENIIAKFTSKGLDVKDVVVLSSLLYL